MAEHHCAHDDHDHHHHGEHAHDHHGHDHHGHEHGFHHHHVHTPANFGMAFIIGITLNLVYIVAEVVWGLWAHSLSLLSDAGHNLSDVLGLGGAWLAQHLAQRTPSRRFTYGLKRSTILSALGNAVLLLVVTGGIVWEAILRLFHPAPVIGWTVMAVALGGIIVNGITALLFMKGSKDDLNMRGAFVHMAADAGMSFAVVIVGALIMATQWTILDPIVSLVVSFLIILSTWSLLRSSLDLALDGVPSGIDLDAVEQALRGIHNVENLHHLHVWPMSTTETALTVHLVRKVGSVDEDVLLQQTLALLHERFHIDHATVQIETPRDTFVCGHAA
ncbi:cobalt transporter [Kozakia baliensis]|nr:cation diffusion facilitator family transporter [Kozakia baliensis]AOX21439.1 cobalt transporter [Kozakia baliensis]